jgi:predicted acetyltransferase
LVREVWAASRGDVGVMRAGAQRVWASITSLWQGLKVPKNFVSTAALGTFAYVQYETYWVINMSEEQYQASIQALDAKIVNLMVQKQEIANQFQPLLTR